MADVEAADFDRDGDLDLVVAAFGWRAVEATLVFENTAGPGEDPSFVRGLEDARAGAAGDMLDDYLLKPWHGIQWLENRGGFPFVPHPVAALRGVHRAVASDIDGDGDVDIAACSFVQKGGSGAEDLVSDLPSLVWLEHLPDGRFERHTLEVGGQHVFPGRRGLRRRRRPGPGHGQLQDPERDLGRGVAERGMKRGTCSA